MCHSNTLFSPIRHCLILCPLKPFPAFFLQHSPCVAAALGKVHLLHLTSYPLSQPLTSFHTFFVYYGLWVVLLLSPFSSFSIRTSFFFLSPLQFILFHNLYFMLCPCMLSSFWASWSKLADAWSIILPLFVNDCFSILHAQFGVTILPLKNHLFSIWGAWGL